MNVVNNEDIVCFDVDGTLVIPDTDPHTKDITIVNPYSGTPVELRIHHAHVELLKIYRGRGCFVRVWSHGGVKWAEAVVKALNLEKYVDSIETKPAKLIDDLPIERIFKTIFLEENGGEKRK